MSPFHRRGHELLVPERHRYLRLEVGSSSHNDDRELPEDVAEDLEYLTANIDAPHIDDLPWWM